MDEQLSGASRWDTVHQLLPRLLTYGGYALLALLIGTVAANETLPVDYRGYAWAASSVAQGQSPYRAPEESQAIWRDVHQLGERLERDAAAQDLASGGIEAIGNLYLYPPTLATALAQAGVSSAEQDDSSFTPAEAGAVVGAVLLFLAVVAFAEGWLQATRAAARRRGKKGPSAWWLLLVLLSWDVIASFAGVNVELLLLAFSFGAAGLLWRGHSVLAAVLAAVVLLMKPYYLLFFAAFGLLMITARWARWPEVARQVGMAGGAVAGLVGLEVLRWPAYLRTDYLRYMGNAMEHVWLSLPMGMQTPLSSWNRTPLQVLVTAGVPPETAAWLSLGLWAALLSVTDALAWRRRISFPMVFGLAYALFFIGRPVSWTLPYLDVVLLAAWPVLRPGWERAALGVGVVALGFSHWAALARTIGGYGPDLLTLQSAAVPWETLAVLPLAWGLLLVATRRQPSPPA